MLENNKIMQEEPKTIDYNEEIAVEQLKENLRFMEMKKASFFEIENECKVLDEKIWSNERKWSERTKNERAEGASITKYNEFLKEIGGDKIKDRRGLLLKSSHNEKLLYHLYKRNFEYFLDYYIYSIVYSVIINYNGKKVGEKTGKKITKEFEDKFLQSDFGLYLKENTEKFRLFSYISGKEVFGSRRFHVEIMGIKMDYHIFDNENKVIDCENDWFKVNHNLYDVNDIEKLAEVIKCVYKEMQKELIEFNKNRDIFNILASGVCEYIREPAKLYDSMNLRRDF